MPQYPMKLLPSISVRKQREMSSQATPDLAKISAPSEIPPASPDKKTEEEEKDLRKLTPTEQLTKVHSEHVEELIGHIDYHREECGKWKEEVDQLQKMLLREREKITSLSSELASLK